MKLPIAIALVVAASSATSVNAKEGPDQYPNGAESFMAGALPPPGNYFLNYLGHYDGSLRDSTGDKVVIAGKSVDADVDFDALRFVHVTQSTLFGASVAFQAIVPVVKQSIDIAAFGGRNGRTGLGDVSFDPLILGWHWNSLHVTTGMDVYLPTGSYSISDPRQQIGTHYFTFEPVVAATYLTPAGFEFSAKAMYDINLRNPTSKYTSGDDFHMDYVVAKHEGNWAFGIGGYVEHQLEDDRSKAVAADGHRGRALAIGPDVNLNLSPTMQLIFQWQHEFDVRDRFSGNKIWFRLNTAY